MSLRKLGGETVIYGLSSVLGRLLNFLIVTPFLTRVLPTEEFGVVGILFFWTGLLIAFLVFRMDTVVFRFASRAENDAQAVFRYAQTFVTALVVTVIGGMYFFAADLADWLQYPDRVIYVQLVLATVAFDALSAVPLARLRLEGRPWFFVAVNLGNVLVNLLLIFLLLYRYPRAEVMWGYPFLEGYRVAYYLATIALASALRYLVLLADGVLRSAARRRASGGARAPGRVPPLREMLVYSLPLTLVAVALIINALAGPELIQRHFGGTVTQNLYWSGQFNGALKLAVFLNLFITAYNYAAEPFFFRQAGNDLATADKGIYADALRAYAVLGILASAAILLLLPWLKDFLDEGEQLGLFILPGLLTANLLFGMYSNFAIAYKLTDKTYLGGAIALTGSLIAVSLSILLMEGYGLWAPALGMVACYAVMCLLAWGVSRRYFPVAYPLGRLFGYFLLAAGTVYLADHTDLLGARTQDAGWERVALLLLLAALVLGLEARWIRRTFLD